MKVLKELLSSKKALATITAIAMVVAAKLGLDDETAKFVADRIAALAGCYVVGQGMADWGKAKALVLAGLKDAVADD